MVSDSAEACPNCGRQIIKDVPADTASATSRTLNLLRLRRVQLAALAVALLIASTSQPTEFPDTYRVGAGAAVVLVAFTLASVVLVWKSEIRGFIPLLTLILVTPMATWVNPERSASSQELAQDVHSCYQRWIEVSTRNQDDLDVPALDQQQRAGGYVRECLFQAGWSEADRVAVIPRPR